MSLKEFNLATWNVNSLRVRLPHLEAWLAATGIDALGIQETKLRDEEFPHADVGRLGLQGFWHGQRTYNGVALLARSGVEDVVRGMPGFEDEQARVIAGTVAGRAGDRRLRAEWPERRLGQVRLQAALAGGPGRLPKREALARYERLAVIGDFQHRPGGPRRARSGRLGWSGAGKSRRAGRARADHR